MKLSVTIPGRPVARRSGRKAGYRNSAEVQYLRRLRGYVFVAMSNWINIHATIEDYATLQIHDWFGYKDKVWLSAIAYFPDKRRPDADNIAKIGSCC